MQIIGAVIVWIKYAELFIFSLSFYMCFRSLVGPRSHSGLVKSVVTATASFPPQIFTFCSKDFSLYPRVHVMALSNSWLSKNSAGPS